MEIRTASFEPALAAPAGAAALASAGAGGAATIDPTATMPEPPAPGRPVRRVAAVLASVMLAATAALATAGVARASAPYPPSQPVGTVSALGRPISPAYCNGNVCARVYLAAGAWLAASVVVRVWALSQTFYGHFELQLPDDDAPLNSSDGTNTAGDFGQLFNIPNNPGQVTVQSWKETGPGSWASTGSTGWNGPVFFSEANPDR